MNSVYTVTGGTGYIGSQLLKELSKDKDALIYAIIRESSKPKVEADNIKYIVFDGTEKSIEEAIKLSDFLIHLAALYDTRTDEDTTRNLIESNVLFSTMLFNIANRVNKDIVISTASTFSALDGDGQYAPTTLYAATKAAVETIAHFYKDLSIHFLTFPDTYGPNDWRNKIHNILGRNENWPFQFKSRAEQEIRIMHVEDVIGHLLSSLEHSTKGVHIHDIYAAAELLTLKDLAKKVTDKECLFNTEAELVRIPQKPRVNAEPIRYRHKHPHFNWPK